jgi:hypothetical protein
MRLSARRTLVAFPRFGHAPRNSREELMNRLAAVTEAPLGRAGPRTSPARLGIALALVLAACSRESPRPLAPPSASALSSAGPPKLEPATTAGSAGAFVYRGVLAGASASDRPPAWDSERGGPYPGPDEQILLGSSLTPFVEFTIEGYFKSCIEGPEVELRSGDGWRKVPKPFAPKGNYFLDGKYVGYGMCDVVSCQAVAHRIRVPLVEFVAAKAPPGALPEAANASAYESRPLRGEIRVTFPHYASDSCSSRELAEHLVLL